MNPSWEARAFEAPGSRQSRESPPGGPASRQQWTTSLRALWAAGPGAPEVPLVTTHPTPPPPPPPLGGGFTVRLTPAEAVLPLPSVTLTVTEYGELESSPVVVVQLNDATSPGALHPDGNPDQ